MTLMGQMGTASDDESETDPYVRQEESDVYEGPPYVQEGVLQDLLKEMDYCFVVQGRSYGGDDPYINTIRGRLIVVAGRETDFDASLPDNLRGRPTCISVLKGPGLKGEGVQLGDFLVRVGGMLVREMRDYHELLDQIKINRYHEYGFGDHEKLSLIHI